MANKPNGVLVGRVGGLNKGSRQVAWPFAKKNARWYFGFARNGVDGERQKSNAPCLAEGLSRCGRGGKERSDPGWVRGAFRTEGITGVSRALFWKNSKRESRTVQGIFQGSPPF